MPGEFKEDKLGNEKLPISPLLHKGHELIAIVRAIQEFRESENPFLVAIIDDDIEEVERLLEKRNKPQHNVVERISSTWNSSPGWSSRASQGFTF